MIARILWREVRRTMILPFGVGFLVVANFLAQDPMSGSWPGLVMPVLSGHQNNLFLLWPLALAIGTAIGGRDRAAGVSELLSTTTRHWTRIAPRAALLTLGLAAAYLVAPADQLISAAQTDSYWPKGWAWSLLAGALTVAAAALLGLALGRSLPSRLLVPVVGVVAMATIGLGLLLAEYHPSRAWLLIPSYLGPDAGQFATTAARTNAAQATWFLALGIAGLLLCSVTKWDRRRTLSATGAVLITGLTAALLLFPSPNQAQIQDAGATKLVCAEGLPRVCVARPYAKSLPELVAPARAALRALAQLPNAPTTVLQDTRDPRKDERQPPETVLLDLVLDHEGHLVTGGTSLEESILDGAGAMWCAEADDSRTLDQEYAARTIAASWLLNRKEPLDTGFPEVQKLTETAWTALRSQPTAVQRERIAALRTNRLECRDDGYAILLGTPVAS
ncbi:hypothetical protein Kisp01_27810 [Kineosporia sp. NBRC 101677]|uniref:hypothetical protein n=1 Tax=Kineosporia sp. NBRC 101677 TaxID=3032197 RepID=UPI0024A58DB8|nr:hypothetical protein [Kineosporia sp. NBRC 101677]GLY15766.1 hypothetical protein Kisp01_27810 [Kineosporia sp. NBRC 101677]